ADSIYVLEDDFNDTSTSFPIITSDLTIRGNGAKIERQEFTDSFRLFEVAGNGFLKLETITLSQGSTNGNGGGIYINGGQVSLNNVKVIGNYASEHGGAIHNMGFLTIIDTEFRDNQSAQAGGAIQNAS